MINNCFNYVGSKDRMFQLIDDNLYKKKANFIDVFCGSGVVGINELENYDRVVLNDLCWQMTETLKCFRDNSQEEILDCIDAIIEGYALSKQNKEGFLLLRQTYNNNNTSKEDFSPFMFYCLVTHSFNYNIHINSSGGFSVPFGQDRSYFNSSLREKFKAFQEVLHKNKQKVTIKSLDFYKLIKSAEKIIPDTVFYLDPPYLSSDDAYSRIHYLGKWNEEKEARLLECLDFINEKGGKFLLSNVLENNGKVNELLTKWSKKYHTVRIVADYTNCNYQRKNSGKTKEVMIRNY